MNSLHYLRCVENVQTASGDTAKMSLAGVRPMVKLDGVVDPVKSSVNPIKSSLMDPTCKYDIKADGTFLNDTNTSFFNRFYSDLICL